MMCCIVVQQQSRKFRQSPCCNTLYFPCVTCSASCTPMHSGSNSNPVITALQQQPGSCSSVERSRQPTALIRSAYEPRPGTPPGPGLMHGMNQRRHKA
jgi:hypothetical protein